MYAETRARWQQRPTASKTKGGNRDLREELTVSPLACSGRVGVDRSVDIDGELVAAG